MNDIIEFLDLEDPNVFISSIKTVGTVKTITVESYPTQRFCPLCNFKMHSRGITIRNVNHPILQDTYSVKLKVKQRRWKCSNPNCGFTENESFNFLKRYKRNTNATEILIVFAFKDLSLPASHIASKFNVSTTFAIDTFNKYVSLKRLPLSEVVSIDEVYVDMDNYCKYALVLQDFKTGNTIDMLQSRRKSVTEPYFLDIPFDERKNVKYLISDMYNPYISYVDSYFPNATSVVDSFHVIQWINREIDNYLRVLLKAYKERDKKKEEELSDKQGYDVHLSKSKEVYLLQNHKWVMLRNKDNIDYSLDLHFDKHLRQLMNTYDYEYDFFKLDPHLKDIRKLKDMYIDFNRINAGDIDNASKELTKLIQIYLDSGFDMFVNFAKLLKKYRKPILNSFVMIQKNGLDEVYDSRMSNGPIESLNRKISSLVSSGRGYRNFDHFRNRILFSTRKDPPLKG